jgi:hypothetical protein
MNALASAVVALLTQLLPLLSSTGSSQIGAILNALIEIIPLVIKEATALIEPVKNIISALSANPATTVEQMAILAKLDAQCDADFEDAAQADGIAPESAS